MLDGKTRTRHAELLRSGRWFRGLAEDRQADLLDAAVARTLGPGEQLFARGDAPDGLYAVVDGVIRVTGTAESDKEVLLAIVEPPGWFGEIAVFDGDARTHDAVAQTTATVLHIPQRPLDAILTAHPAFWRDLGLLLAAKMRLMFTVVEDAAAMPLAARLARRLLVTAGGHGELLEGARRTIAVSQEQLATMLGTSRQTLNATLKALEAQGLVRVSYGQIELLDFDGLRRIARGA